MFILLGFSYKAKYGIIFFVNTVVSVYKPIGYTPLQVIDTLRKKCPDYTNEKIGYAGRLDPLAHGVLLLMIGDAAKERTKYLDLPKEYSFEVLYGLETDTYDLLGYVERYKECIIVKENVNAFVNDCLGKLTLPYPPYSSKPVDGKPLFWWARHKKLSEITIPTREIEIAEFKLRSTRSIRTEQLQRLVMKRIHAVTGDFRQADIEERWMQVFETNPQISFATATFHITCSSGTYVRSLAHTLGQELGCGAVAIDILRTKVGTYSLEDSTNLFVAGE